jgi:hypothetical protein
MAVIIAAVVATLSGGRSDRSEDRDHRQHAE